MIVSWGDRVFPNSDDYFGYNKDYRIFTDISINTVIGYLWVNHEYVSFPFSDLAPEAPGDLKGLSTTFESVIGWALPTTNCPNTSGYGYTFLNNIPNF